MGSSSSDGGLSVKTPSHFRSVGSGGRTDRPLIWEPGTLIATAATPIIVAVFKETLRRPADRDSQAPAIGKKVDAVPRGARHSDRPRGGAAAVEKEQTNDRAGRGADHEPDTTSPDHEPDTRPGPHQRDTRPGPHQRDTTSDAASRARRRRLRIAVITGLLAFVIVAAVLTTSELLAGESLTGGGRTTLFDGDGDPERAPQLERMQTTPAPTAEMTPVTTPTPTTTTPTPITTTPGR